MPRAIPAINCAQFLTTPTIATDPQGTTGIAAVSYSAGVYSDVPRIVNNVQVGTDTSITLHPSFTQSGNGSAVIASSDTMATALPKLIMAVLAAEGLNPAQGDRVYSSDGSRLV